MNLELATPLLAGLSPLEFMRKHWHKRPLLVRGAMPVPCAPLGRAGLFALAARDDVEARLIVRNGKRWNVRQGPFLRRALPPLRQAGWTLLVQGVDLHVDAAHRLLSNFRFVPDARLDDVMMSFATTGGGVGPHCDSYDVFLLQVQGRRRWRAGPVRDAALQPDAPLKLLRNFEPDSDWLLEPGDMLYLPPNWAHDGVAEGECMTCSIGFRAPARLELAREVMQRIIDEAGLPDGDTLYDDPRQPATAQPGLIPPMLRAFAERGVSRLLRHPVELDRALGEVISEPKPRVVFDAGGALRPGVDACLDRRTRMMYDARHVFINGEAYRMAGRDARLMRVLCDRRRLGAAEISRLSPQASTLLDAWAQAGWMRSASRQETEDEPS
jgi:50S ribosomal protein L16 3-hydroxylase